MRWFKRCALAFFLIFSHLSFAPSAIVDRVISSEWVDSSPSSPLFLMGGIIIERDVHVLQRRIVPFDPLGPLAVPADGVEQVADGVVIRGDGSPTYTHPGIQHEPQLSGQFYFMHLILLSQVDLGDKPSDITLWDEEMGRKIDFVLSEPPRKVSIPSPHGNGYHAYMLTVALGGTPQAQALNLRMKAVAGGNTSNVLLYHCEKRASATKREYFPELAPPHHPKIKASVTSSLRPTRDYAPDILVKNVDIIEFQESGQWRYGVDIYVWVKDWFYVQHLRNPVEEHFGTERTRPHGYEYAWAHRAYLDRFHVIDANNPSNQGVIVTTPEISTVVTQGDMELYSLSYRYQVFRVRRYYSQNPGKIHHRYYIQVDRPGAAPFFSNQTDPHSFFEVVHDFKSAECATAIVAWPDNQKAAWVLQHFNRSVEWAP